MPESSAPHFPGTREYLTCEAGRSCSSPPGRRWHTSTRRTSSPCPRRPAPLVLERGRRRRRRLLGRGARSADLGQRKKPGPYPSGLTSPRPLARNASRAGGTALPGTGRGRPDPYGESCFASAWLRPRAWPPRRPISPPYVRAIPAEPPRRPCGQPGGLPRFRELVGSALRVRGLSALAGDLLLLGRVRCWRNLGVSWQFPWEAKLCKRPCQAPEGRPDAAPFRRAPLGTRTSRQVDAQEKLDRTAARPGARCTG